MARSIFPCVSLALMFLSTLATGELLGQCARPSGPPAAAVPAVAFGPVHLQQASLPSGTPVALRITDCDGDGILDGFIPWSDASAAPPATLYTGIGICPIDRVSITFVGNSGSTTWRAFGPAGLVATQTRPGGGPQTVTLVSGGPRIVRVELQGAEVCVKEVCWTCKPRRFLRADVNVDGNTDISDVLAGLDHLFLGTEAPSCRDAADANDDGRVDLSDSILVLNYLFLGAELPRGADACSEDDSEDDLDCENAGPCEDDETVDSGETVVSDALRFEGEVVDVLPSGQQIRRIAIYRGRRFEWNGKVENRVAAPELRENERGPIDVDELSEAELAEHLRALTLYAGHEFLESEPATDLARAVKEYRALERQGAPTEQLEQLLPPRRPYQGEGEPIRDFQGVEQGERRDNVGQGGGASVHGDDDRGVMNNRSYPHRTQIVFDNAGSTTTINGSQGSGSLVGPSTAMSVAHVFWDESANTWEATHLRAAGFDNQDSDPSPYGDWRGCYWVTIPVGYVLFENSTYDYAVIDFDVGCDSVENGVNSDRPGSTVGWLGTSVASASTIESHTGYVRGYPATGTCGDPGAACNVRVWGDHSSSSENDARSVQIRHQADTTGGNSGSAFYQYLDPSCSGCGYGPYLVGMHRAGSSSYNLARRFTSSVYSFLLAYSSDYP